MTEIHAIILTKDEEQHIERCIRSLGSACASITVVDSGSTDRTVEIAKDLGAEVVHNPWINYAVQMNFAIRQLAGRGGWLLRIDADEVLDPDSRETLSEAVGRAAENEAGLLVRRRIHFLGRRIAHGAIEPSWQLRLWRNGMGECEQRWMDEHIQVDGDVAKTGIILSDINLNSLTWWIAKHNSYASREAVDILNLRHGFLEPQSTGSMPIKGQAKWRRFMKTRVYSRLSPGLRAFVYYIYRYIFRLGFLDGRPGFFFHTIQGYWYRTLVDAKVSEIEDYAEKTGCDLPTAIRDRTGIDVMI